MCIFDKNTSASVLHHTHTHTHTHTPSTRKTLALSGHVKILEVKIPQMAEHEAMEDLQGLKQYVKSAVC